MPIIIPTTFRAAPLEERKPGEEEGRITVVSQIEKYEKFIGNTDSARAIIDAYVGVCDTLVDLHQQGWTRELDPLVEDVARKQTPLTIHPKVYLLVYDFDDDQKKGDVKNRLERLGERLGHRVMAKGDPRSFSLSKDIVRREGAA
jgi:hypothetical protein